MPVVWSSSIRCQDRGHSVQPLSYIHGGMGSVTPEREGFWGRRNRGSIPGCVIAGISELRGSLSACEKTEGCNLPGTIHSRASEGCCHAKCSSLCLNEGQFSLEARASLPPGTAEEKDGLHRDQAIQA